MSSLDQSASHAALEAFFDAEGGNDKGVEAAILKYLDDIGLRALHDQILANNNARDARNASLVAQARREQRFGGRSS